jgi:hypothetical protein
MELRTSPTLDVLDAVFLALAALLAGIHLYLGLFAAVVPDERATQFVLIGLALLVGPVVYLTPYWRPLLYLLGAGFATYLGVLWLLGGMELFLLGVFTGALATGFVILGIVLVLRESASVVEA